MIQIMLRIEYGIRNINYIFNVVYQNFYNTKNSNKSFIINNKSYKIINYNHI